MKIDFHYIETVFLFAFRF